MRSYNEIVTYRRCQRKHYYSRVLNIEPVAMGWRIDFGNWWDELMIAAYTTGEVASRHYELVEAYEAEVIPFTTDAEALALPELILQVFGRWDAHWYGRDQVHEVLHIQESFDWGGIGVTPDLVYAAENGDIWVRDYKTSKSIPEEWDLMADTQHLLYVGAMRAKYGSDVRGVEFDYIRSRLPTVPRLVKTKGKYGPIADIKRIDTDYQTLLDFALLNGIAPYPELSERLAELEMQDPFFKRMPLLTPQASCDIAYQEALATAFDIRRAIVGGIFPRTVLPQAAGVASCNACSFKEICQAELFGLSTESAMMLYQERTPLDREYTELT